MAPPKDDKTILNNDNLIRGLDPENHIVSVDGVEGRRVSSSAFQRTTNADSDAGMSVYIESAMKEAKQDPKEIVGKQFEYSVAFIAGELRKKPDPDLSIGRTPLEGNDYHGDVWKIRNGAVEDLSKPEKRKLLSMAKRYMLPHDIKLGRK